MHTKEIRIPLRKAVCLDERQLACLGVCALSVDAIEPGTTMVEVYLEVEDGADDIRILDFIRSM